MQQQDKPAFLATINGLAAIKPGAKITTEALDMWWLALKDWGIEDFKKAATLLAKTSEFMPNPYHFEQLRKASNPTSGEAFQKAMLLARRAPPRELPSLTSGDDAIDSAVRALGGYTELANCESGKLHFLERRFAEHYETISEVEETRRAIPLLSNGSLPQLRQLAESKRIGRA